MRRARIGTVVALVGALGAGGCTGDLNVYLRDSSQEAPGGELELKAFELPLDHVEARREGGWEALSRGPDPYNLLDFSGEPTVVDLLALRDTPTRIVNDEIEVGEISAFRLVLTPRELFAVTTADGISHPLDPPPQDTLEVPGTLEVIGGAAAERTFDLRVRDCLFVDEDGVWTFVPELRVDD